MVDTLSKAERSSLMSRVRSSNTKPEMMVRRFLHQSGLRYFLHRKDLPGTPDLVFPRKKIALFVHGCFWHQHPGCRRSKIPITRTEFWAQKLKSNVDRDLSVQERLREEGCNCMVIWECEINVEYLEDLACKLREASR